ncbi:hypothetical protein QBC32DRAFT_271528 [Pseudoneurospora amorphoporcata]|uniref:BTB domain-containing protein n=1 Tax=Pseudoneurospora amorphoporcata TaxID=241081 RepID=A0AAN6NJK7_9PEZI|nr:hypothetical protein QBC32DRAFT_271528 [Pseudoneurospora amorphoporcata]
MDSGETKAESHNNTSYAVLLDPEGDVILVVADQNILVSSVFSKMFGPDFSKGIQIRHGDRPCVNLEEDDPKAMESLLRILHYQCADISFSMEPKPLAVLAIHCDKYNCIAALRPWIAQWCSNHPGITAPEQFGYMLLAAYMFRSPIFSGLAAEATKQLAPGFVSVWEEHETLALLPETITADALSEQITQTLERLHQELQSTEGRLREQKARYTMPGFVCVNCGRIHPDTAKKCHPCNNTDLFSRRCTSDYRVAEYFTILRRCELWPSLEPFATLALSDLAFRFKCAQTDYKHQCGAKEDCPLRRELELLSERVQWILKCIKGIPIEKGVEATHGRRHSLSHGHLPTVLG